MRSKKIILLIVGIIVCSATAVWASASLQGTLTVTLSEDRANLEIMYTVRNMTGSIIPPNSAEKYYYTIRNVATGREVMRGTLNSAFQTNVSQYAAPYAQAVFAIKRVAIPAAMKNNPGYYLIFLAAGPISNGDEAVFYVPANLRNPNPVISEIRTIVGKILTKLGG